MSIPHTASDLKRRNGNKNRPRILIICEGKATEPKYFHGIRRNLRLSSTNICPIESIYKQPLKNIQYAEDFFIKDKRKWDEIYCVFDRDDHDGYLDAIEKAKNKRLRNDYNKIVKFVAIPSNPCFELWFLIHFVDFNRSEHRNTVQHLLKSYIEGYKKGEDGYFNETFARIDHAYSVADTLRAICDRNHTPFENPSTDVDVLVKRLLKL